jgi:hypothetical protein
MKYGYDGEKGYWCVRNGVRLPAPILPATEGLAYNDGTGECCDMLLKDWCVDIKLKGWDCWIRFTIKGNINPVLHQNSFDFDFASRPNWTRAISCDKADYRVRAASLLHDILFCVLLEEFGLDVANQLLNEIMEVYYRELAPETGNWLNRQRIKAANALRRADDVKLRMIVYSGVKIGARFCWGKKTPEEIAMYRKMISVEVIGNK